MAGPAALAERIERAHALDPVVHGLSDTVVRALPAGSRTDALHGVPFGQPVHPALVRLPLGCWTSAVLLDLVHGAQRAADGPIAAGTDGTAPAAATCLGARSGASSATCPCWCTGKDPRSACCQTGARISGGPCIRAGSSLSGALSALPAPGTDPPS